MRTVESENEELIPVNIKKSSLLSSIFKKKNVFNVSEALLWVNFKVIKVFCDLKKKCQY